MRAFHHCSDRDRELFRTTIVAFPNAGAMFLALKLRMTVNATAMRADDTVCPADRLKLLAGLVFSQLRKGREVHCALLSLYALCITVRANCQAECIHGFQESDG